MSSKKQIITALGGSLCLAPLLALAVTTQPMPAPESTAQEQPLLLAFGMSSGGPSRSSRRDYRRDAPGPGYSRGSMGRGGGEPAYGGPAMHRHGPGYGAGPGARMGRGGPGYGAGPGGPGAAAGEPGYAPGAGMGRGGPGYGYGPGGPGAGAGEPGYAPGAGTGRGGPGYGYGPGEPGYGRGPGGPGYGYGQPGYQRQGGGYPPQQ
jgi:hypothetical protein